MREIIAQAYRNPELEIRIVPTFGDACIGCSMKRNPRHIERLTSEDRKTLDIMKYQYGDVVKFWDAIVTAQTNVTVQHLKDINKTNIFIEDFMNSITPLSVGF